MLPLSLPLSARIALFDTLPNVPIDPILAWVRERAIHWTHIMGLSVPTEAHLFDLLDFSDAICLSQHAVQCSISEHPRFHRILLEMDGRQFWTHRNVQLSTPDTHMLALTEVIDRHDAETQIQVSLADRPLLAVALIQAGNRALAQGRGALRDRLHDLAIRMCAPLTPLFGSGHPLELGEMLHDIQQGTPYTLSPNGDLRVGPHRMQVRETHWEEQEDKIRTLLKELAP